MSAPAVPDPERCPKYLKLARGFERQLKAGVLRVGDRLPSVRQLRADHQVSVSTAVGCYVWLERQGYVRARPKSGFYVSGVPVPDGLAPRVVSRLRGPVPVRVAALRKASTLPPSEMVQLGAAVVGPALLPMNRLNRSIRLALSAFADNAVRSEDPRGNLRLRRQIARLVFRQGVQCSPDDVLVTSGEAEALNLSIRAVAKPGDVVAVESPGCYDILGALAAYRMRALEIPHVLHEGISLAFLAAAVKKHRVKAILLTATCHTAFGDCVRDESKAAVVSFATRHGIAVIEGDPFGDLVFSGVRPRSLKSFDAAGMVIQCSSLGHYVAPGFNIGWVNAGRWQSEVERLKGLSNGPGARLPQLALAEFLESGAFDKHVKQLRLALWRSVEAARRQILETFPEGTRVSRPEGGFVLWVQLPEDYDGLELQRKAAAAGIVILPGTIFSPTREYAACVRIACGHPFDVMKPALVTLAKLLARTSPTRRRFG